MTSSSRTTGDRQILRVATRATGGIVGRRWVVVGIGPVAAPPRWPLQPGDDPFLIEDSGEVWGGVMVLQCLQKALRADAGWGDLYDCRTSTSAIRSRHFPFVTRSVGERILCQEVFNAMAPFRMPGRKLQDGNTNVTVAAERCFQLLVEDKVLVHPPIKRTGIIAGGAAVISKKDKQLLPSASYYQVDKVARDAWIAARLLLLEEDA